MADNILIDLQNIFFTVFHYKCQCIIYILFLNRVASFGKFNKLIQHFFCFFHLQSISHDLYTFTSRDQCYMKSPFYFLCIYIELPEHIRFMFCRYIDDCFH